MTPTYDPETQTWFLEDGREAKSLREFGCDLENYYPNGVPLELIKQRMQEAATLLGTDAPRPKCAIPVVRETEDRGVIDEWKGGLPAVKVGKPFNAGGRKPGQVGRIPKYDHDAVLNLWHDNYDVSAIVERCSLPHKGALYGILQNAREKSGPRATRKVAA